MGEVISVNCLEAREMFSFNLDNELSCQEQDCLREHMEDCSECSREWKEWERLFAALRQMGEQHISAPSAFSSSVMAQLTNQASPSTRLNWKRWKKAAIGTAAALLLVSGSMLLKPAPVENIAGVQPSEQAGYSQPDTNQNTSGAPTQIALNEEGVAKEGYVSSSNNENPVQKNTAPESPTVSAEFTNAQDCIVLSTFLKIKVDNAQNIEQRAISIAQNQGASVQSLGQQSEGTKVYLVDKIVVNSSQAPGLISSLSGLGSTISSQQQKEDFTTRYSDLLALLISLEGQRNTEQNTEKIATLDRQIEQIKSQLRTWDKRSGEQTIVLWIQQ